MSERINFAKASPGGYRAMLGLHGHLEACGLDESLLQLVFLRASQINGCAFCTDMHWKDLRALGVSEQKLSLLTAWQESPGFTERERAALEWTEAVTLVASSRVPDEVYNAAREQFTEKELADLTLAVAAINAWNRLAVSLRKEAGTYQPAAKASHA